MAAARKIHFTGIDSPLVCDLAIALKISGDLVSGSGAGIPEGADRLAAAGFPSPHGWNPDNLADDLNAVVISPSIQQDNPELIRALELNIPVYSYPEFIREESRNKHRVVITGSHGKTMITRIVLHALNYHGRSFDYVLSRPVKGHANSVKLTDAPVIIIEGADGLASALDPTSIFLKYQHHIGVISGIEWFSSPEYPSKEAYVKQFTLLEKSTPKGGVLIYFDLEPVINAITKDSQPDVLYVPYKTHPSLLDGGAEFLLESSNERHPVKLSGKANMQNFAAAKETVKRLGITPSMFYEAIKDFTGDSF